MLEVLVLCEGQTEREFCNGLLSPCLAEHGVAMRATLRGKPQRKRGGMCGWDVYQRELIRLPGGRRDCHVAVLADYYKMDGTWPGRPEAPKRDPLDRGRFVEQSLRQAMEPRLGSRFHPCVALHEFESLMFVSPRISADTLSRAGSGGHSAGLAKDLAAVVAEFDGSVELINDSEVGAPSKRLQQLVPGYDKVAFATLVAGAVGIDNLRKGCPWLDRWLDGLEKCASQR